MIHRQHHLRAPMLGAAVLAVTASASSAAARPVPELGPGFTSQTAAVGGATLHHVRGGSGPAIVLLHGFPQDWYEWRHVMPRLARRFTVVAVDLRGVGGSEPTGAGYDAATLAEDVHRLARQLKLGRYYVAGHDIGGMVTYALARLHPRELRGAMIVDVPLPGIDPWPEVEADPLLWHFRFHQTAWTGLPPRARSPGRVASKSSLGPE